MSSPSSWRTVISTWLVKLGPLAVPQCGLDGHRVQAELLAQRSEVIMVGGEQVQPDRDGLIGQVLANISCREPRKLRKPPGPVQPRARDRIPPLRARGVREAERGRGHRDLLWFSRALRSIPLHPKIAAADQKPLAIALLVARTSGGKRRRLSRRSSATGCSGRQESVDRAATP
jgi:hypothetical protein